LYSPNIRMVKSVIRWARHVARIGSWRGAYRGLVGKSEGNRALEVLGLGGRILLKWILTVGLGRGLYLAHDGDKWRAVLRFRVE
jgi:hypothetical protein